MAAFSYQEFPFLVDCVLTPDMMMTLSSSSSSPSSTTTSPLLSPSCCFSEDQQPHLLHSNSSYSEPIFHGEQLQFQYPFGNFHQPQINPIDFSLHESSCVEQRTPLPFDQSTPACSDNETSVTPKQSTLIGGGGGGGGGIQNWTPVNNKRRPEGDGSSPNPSKGLRRGRGKKQKKSNNGGVKEEQEEQKKTQSSSPTVAEEAPTGYIHVRARRGQATDSHSLAERARREKISERMKLLQALVPGCDKVTGKATMLDEIIHYVRSLQSQVDFLSMKLTSLNPMVYNFGVDLDALLFGQQGLNNSAPSVGSLQQWSQSTTNPTTETPPTGVVTAAATTGIPTLFHQQGQRGANPSYLEDNVIGSLYWGLGGQGGPDPVNQPGFCTNNNNNMMY